MATTLTYGRKRPVTGDLGSTWFVALEDNITLDDAHDHDGTDSAQLTNAAIATAAAIARSKLASGTASHVLINDGSGVMSSEATLAKSRGGCAADMSSVTFPSSGTIATIAGTQVLTNKDIDGGTAANTSRITFPSGTLAAITALTRKEGTVWYATDTDKLYKDDGTSLTEIGSGSGGSINYISNPDAETATTGWATYADAAGTDPVNGTGGSATVTITRTTSTPLRGTGSFLITKDAANRQGEGVSYDFTIATADQAKVLNVSFDYQVASGTFASGDSSDIRVWIYDVTNSALIAVAPYTIQGGGTSNYHKFTGTFQTASNSTSYRLILHCATTSASAYTFKFDNVIVGPQITVYGSAITDWTTWTPTGSWSSNTTYTGGYRFVGDTMEGWVKIALAGAPTSASLTITLPYTIDTAKLSADTNNQVVGILSINDDGVASYTGRLLYASTTTLAANWVDSNSKFDVVTQASPVTFGNADELFMKFSVPIAGKSSSVLLSSDTDTRVVAMRAGGDPASASSGNPIIFPTAAYDTHSGYNASTGFYTVPVSGYYRVHGFISSANAGVELTISVDGSTAIIGGLTDANGDCAYTGTVKVTAGQTISLEPGGTVDAGSTSTINIERISGPSAIAATESVNARLSGDPASATTTNPMIFPTADYDTHGAYNVSTGLYTVPVSGKYNVSGFVSTPASAEVLHVYVDSSSSAVAAVTDSNGNCSFSASVRVLAGQTISLRPVGATVDADSTSKLYIERVGNY